jgi:hypothetical protein
MRRPRGSRPRPSDEWTIEGEELIRNCRGVVQHDAVPLDPGVEVGSFTAPSRPNPEPDDRLGAASSQQPPGDHRSVKAVRAEHAATSRELDHRDDPADLVVCESAITWLRLRGRRCEQSLDTLEAEEPIGDSDGRQEHQRLNEPKTVPARKSSPRPSQSSLMLDDTLPRGHGSRMSARQVLLGAATNRASESVPTLPVWAGT